MSILKLFLIISILLTISNQTQYVPIPKTTVGIPFGNTSGKIYIELIYDPVCKYLYLYRF